MKKNRMTKVLKVFVTLLVTFAIVFSLMLVSVKAVQYIIWKGTPKVNNLDNNMNRIAMIFKEKDEVITKLENELSEHDGDIEYYETYVNQLVKEIEARDKLINDRDKSITELQEDVLSRDKLLEELRDIIEKLEAENNQAYEDVNRLDIKLEKILEELE